VFKVFKLTKSVNGDGLPISSKFQIPLNESNVVSNSDKEEVSDIALDSIWILR